MRVTDSSEVGLPDSVCIELNNSRNANSEGLATCTLTVLGYYTVYDIITTIAYQITTSKVEKTRPFKGE